MKGPWNRGGLRTYLVLLALVLCRPGQGGMWWGVALLVLGVALHVYAKGSLRQDEVVSTGGPYRFVRHPFYLANLLVDEGIAVMSGSWPLIALLPVWWLLVYVPVMRSEERHLSLLFPETYPAYQQAVPMLVLLRRPALAAGAGFSWRSRNITADTVIPRALRILSLPLLFFVWREVKGNGIGVLAEDAGVDLWAAALVPTAYGLSWILTRHLRDRRRVLPEGVSPRAWRLAAAPMLLLLAGSIHQLESESDITLPLAGCLALVASMVVYAKRRRLRLAAEGIALTAIVALCELPWLTPVPILLYAALALDARLPAAPGSSRPRRLGPLQRLAYAGAYHWILAAGVVVALAKEIL